MARSRIARAGQPTWGKMHFVKVEADEKAVDRALKAEDSPPVPVQRVRKTAAAPAHKRLLGGGGAGGGAFCFAELFADLDLG